MLARASAFIAGPIPARASAFIAASVARASAFIAGDPAVIPTDYAVVFAPDCALVTVSVARDWTTQTGLVARIATQEGGTVPAVTIELTTEVALIRFVPPRDGLYMLLVSNAGGRLYRVPVPVYCRALHCLRELNRPLATGGKGGQASTPSNEWKQVFGRLRMGLAASEVGDYATADGLFLSIASYCTDCGCTTCS